MSPNDSFEHQLRSLPRRSLPEAWRAEILREAATPHTTLNTPRIPRWLQVGWALAWAAILVMAFTMPEEPARQPSTSATHDHPRAAITTPFHWDQRSATISDMLAAH